MNITKTSSKILQLFVAHITESFTLREIARKLNMHVSSTHRAIHPLLEQNIIKQDKHKRLSLNYKNKHNMLIFAEYLRRDEFLTTHKDIKLFKNDVINKIKEDCFILLVFGSAIQSKTPRDIDILLIVNNSTEFHERFLHNIASNYEKIEERVISFESVYEMLKTREEKNIMNEILNKHIILYGAELFYRLLTKGRR